MQRHIALRVCHPLWKHYLPNYLSKTCDIDLKKNELVIEDSGALWGQKWPFYLGKAIKRKHNNVWN